MLLPFAGHTNRPMLEGEWTGTLASVQMIDRDGRAWDAAAVKIKTGPQLPYAVTNDSLIARRTALLLNTWYRPHRILDPRDLRLPLGSRVRVTGPMLISSVNAPPSAERSASGVVYPVDVGEQYEDNLALVILRPELHLLKSRE